MDARVSNPNPRGIHLDEEPEFALGSAIVDPAAHEIRFGGNVVRIQAQPMRVLVALAQAKGRLVTRQAIAEQCWDGRIVGDDVINRAILILRGAAKKSGAFEIETIPREGYRLTASSTSTGPGAHIGRWITGAIAVLVLAGFAAWALAPSAPQPIRVEVLPLVSHSAKEASLSADVTGSIIHALMESGFAVSDGGTGSSNATIDYRIKGESDETAGRVRFSLQMEDARRGILVLSRQFERPLNDASGLPDEIAASVAANIGGIANPMSLEQRQPVSPAIPSNFLSLLYLQGTQSDPFRAYQVARQKLPQAPNSAIAQSALAASTGFVLGELPEHDRGPALIEGRAAAAEAERLAPDFADNQLFWCLLHPHVEFAACEARLRKGLLPGQEASTVPLALSVLLLETGQYDQALKFARISSAAAPYDPIKRDFLIQALEIAGLDREAAQATAFGQRGWPDHQPFTWNRVMGLSARGDLRAIARVDQTTSAKLVPYDREAVRRVLEATRRGQTTAVRQVCLNPALRGSTKQICLAALIHLSDLDSAFAIADVLYPRSWGTSPSETEKLWLHRPEIFPLTFLSSPAAASMRRDPRFAVVAERTGLLAYWRQHRPDYCRSEDCRWVSNPLTARGR